MRCTTYWLHARELSTFILWNMLEFWPARCSVVPSPSSRVAAAGGLLVVLRGWWDRVVVATGCAGPL